MSANKTNAKDLPASLTDDKKVISSMKAVQRAGFWATLGGGLIILYYLFTVLAAGAGLNQLIIFGPWSAYLIWSGYKMNKLDGNNSIVAMLIVNIIIGGFISLQAIFSIIALAKIGAYKQWRNNEGEFVPPKQSTNIKKITCDVHVLDPIKGEIVEERTVDGTTYNKYVAKSGKVHAIRSYDDGKPKTAIINEDLYKATRKAFGIK